MKKLALLSLTLLAAGCMSFSDVVYRPAEQKTPAHIKKIAVRPFNNKTPQFGLEEKLTLKVIDEFTKNAEYTIVPESEAEGVIVGDITNYIQTAIQYDVNMVTTVYKLTAVVSVSLLDKTENRYLWEEPALTAKKIYSVSTLPGGMTEAQAREDLWSVLARNIVIRTVDGFGSVMSESPNKLPAAPEQEQSSDGAGVPQREGL